MIDRIQGGTAIDHRGQIRFINDFDMSLVKRFYIIKNTDVELIRGWRAHFMEQRWFYVLSGKFAFDIVKIDDWNQPSSDLPVEKIILDNGENQLLHLSAGYGTALQALEPDSELLVFADYGIDNAQNDDYTYPLDYFINRKLT
ncbi:WxcM-like domain-containing protein [Sphingobacterium sp.]|uniref:WxcM-like domain-containing protein n=1 Tax=Sphingobacterium sp. TaxID=341027 RepID=UPI0025854E57|nr:WxcM-like domain-containing protein [Sphingobacterium sp.]WET70805.1 MAG: WxcM-like domain-containing protein [Sphingobacterium sp.]